MSEKIRPLIIVGARAFGREVLSYVNDINNVEPQWDFLGFVDEYLAGETPEGHKIIGPDSVLANMDPKPWVVVAIGNSQLRKKVVNSLEIYDVRFATLIHPSVYMGKSINVGSGTIICQGALLTTNVQIGDHCIINVHVTIGHDTIINDYASVMSNSAIAGDVRIGEGNFIGLNCTVIDKVSIGEWSTIGAGTVVVKDLPSNVTAVGVPAKVIKRN